MMEKGYSLFVENIKNVRADNESGSFFSAVEKVSEIKIDNHQLVRRSELVQRAVEDWQRLACMLPAQKKNRF